MYYYNNEPSSKNHIVSSSSYKVIQVQKYMPAQTKWSARIITDTHISHIIFSFGCTLFLDDGHLNYKRSPTIPITWLYISHHLFVAGHMNRNSFFFHCRNGHLNVATYLIEKWQVNINATATDKSTPLHLACQ